MPMDVLSTDLYGQALPFNLEAEQSVLGALLLDPHCIPEVMELIKPEYFHRTQHQDLYAVMVRMFTMGGHRSHYRSGKCPEGKNL